MMGRPRLIVYVLFSAWISGQVFMSQAWAARVFVHEPEGSELELIQNAYAPYPTPKLRRPSGSCHLKNMITPSVEGVGSSSATPIRMGCAKHVPQ
jgi:hypothetical protein